MASSLRPQAAGEELLGFATPGTQAFSTLFEDQADPDGVLRAEIRAGMARHACTAYMQQVAERPDAVAPTGMDPPPHIP